VAAGLDATAGVGVSVTFTSAAAAVKLDCCADVPPFQNAAAEIHAKTNNTSNLMRIIALLAAISLI
jgi:hypothetical protein